VGSFFKLKNIFDPIQAERFTFSASSEQVVLDLLRLLYLCDIQGVSIIAPEFLTQQEAALVYLQPILSRQLPTGGRLPPAEDQLMYKFVSTPLILIFFGYLGTNFSSGTSGAESPLDEHL
jgi:hypothetical protein